MAGGNKATFMNWCLGFTCFFLSIHVMYGGNAYVYNPGRHICVNKQLIQTRMKKIQTYCVPIYSRQLVYCGSYRMCSTFRVIYRLAYRTTYHTGSHTQVVYGCCSGWTQFSPKSTGCMKPVCQQGCNGGKCIKPELCKCLPGWTGRNCKTDVDECRGSSHGCQHKCENTVGSFRCACLPGFNLATDGKTCKLCLHCTPEYKKVLSGYTDLSSRVKKLEQEKEQLLRNISHLQQEYAQKMDEMSLNLKTMANDVPKMDPRPYRPPKFYYTDNRLEDLVASLSDQISLLEERIGLCSCGTREGRRPPV